MDGKRIQFAFPGPPTVLVCQLRKRQARDVGEPAAGLGGDCGVTVTAEAMQAMAGPDVLEVEGRRQ